MNTFILARKFHRILVLLITITGLIMAVTGAVMKFPDVFAPFPFIDPVNARILHGQTSTYFSIVFSLMMLTGLIMYFYPFVRKRLERKPQEN